MNIDTPIRELGPVDVTDLREAILAQEDVAWEEDQYLREAGFGEIMEYPYKDLHQSLNESRLCVATSNTTVFLETLASNFPTILFLNPTHWELRSKARPFYEELRRVGILHDSPEAAALLVNRIFKDPSDWWFQSERQKVRENFCEEFDKNRISET